MIESKVKVSVIVPVYNTEKWLSECLESVLSQTLTDIEVIAVDDCSPDGSKAVMEGFAARDPRMRCIFLDENMGQGNARNIGIEEAKGEYIYLLDSDDMIKPDALERLCAAADEHGLDGLFFDSEVIFDDPGLERKHASYPAARSGKYPAEPVSGPGLFELFMEQGEWTCYIQRQLWRRDFLLREGIRFPVRHEHEDEVFAFEALLAAERAMYIPEKAFIRRYREGSVMTKDPAPENFYGYARCMIEMLTFLDERGISSKGADRNIARIYEKLTRYYASLSKDHDLSALFSEDERQLYLFFEASQKAYLYYADLSPELTEKARGAGSVYIYGAGVIGKNVYEGLALSGIAVEGFLVTGGSEDGSVVKGRTVRRFSEADLPEDAFIVIAAGEGYRREIECELEGAGIEYCYYRK